MRTLALSFLAATQLTGCASHEMIEVSPPLEAIQAQQKTLSEALDQEDPVGALLEHDRWTETWQLELVQEGTTYQFSLLMNRDTNATFGFLRRDAALVSLLSTDHATRMWRCLTPFNLDKDHWSDVSFDALFEWAITQSVAGDREALSAAGTLPRYADDSSSAKVRRRIDRALGEVMSAIVYSPFLLVGIPMYYLSGQDEEDARQREQRERERALLDELELGEPAPVDEQLVPTSKLYLDSMVVHRYDRAGFAYGVRGGQVVMIESPSLAELYERQRAYGPAWYERDDCRELLPNASLR